MNDATSNSMILPGSTTRTVSPYYDEELSLIHRSVIFFNIFEKLFFIINDSLNKEIEWNKTKIKMEQKIGFMEIQLKEINDRENNLKNLNNSIMTAFNDISKEPPTTVNIILSFFFPFENYSLFNL